MKITRKELPEVFESIDQFIIEDSKKEHRRGPTFYTQSIVEINADGKKWCPNTPNYEDYLGTWETNQYVSSDSDVDYSEIQELTKVEKREVVITVMQWVPVDAEQKEKG